MKTCCFALLFFLLTASSYSQIDNYNLFPTTNNNLVKDIIPIYDSIYIYKCNSWDEDWELYQKIKDFAYLDNQIISQTTYARFFEGWEPLYLEKRVYSSDHDPDSIIIYVKSYDWENYQLTIENYSNHKLIDQTKRSGNGHEWSPPGLRIIQTWDPEGHLLSRIDQGLHSGVLQNQNRYLYTYSAGKKMSEQHDGWLNNAWLEHDRTTYNYDQLGRLSIVYYESWVVSSWNKSRKVIYYYSPENVLDSLLVKLSDEGVWNDKYKATCFYNNQNQLVKYLQVEWDGSQWVNFHKQEKNYDEYGYENYNSEAYWQDGEWIIYEVERKTFDPDGLIVSHSTTNYDQFGSRSGDSTQYFFKKVVGLEEPGEIDINVYPNPGNGIYVIDTPEQISEIEVYNTMGLIVHHFSSPIRIIDMKGLPKGMYLLKINLRGKVVVKKVAIISYL